MTERTVSVLGCGWLGLPLAQRLVREGYLVKGSTTRPEKLPILERSNITPFLIQCLPGIHGRDLKVFFQSSVLFLNIPFRRNLADPSDYQRQIESVILHARSSPIEFVIFAGSTSVYPDSMPDAREDAPFIPDNRRARVLYDIEQSLLGNSHFQATVIRFGGLYGGTRKIGGFLAEKKEVQGGDRPVNLIHRDDCIEIVVRIIAQDIRGEILNACSDGHPTRRELYTKAALRIGLDPPQFEEEPPASHKIVRNGKLKKLLNYTFQHPDPLDMSRIDP